MNTRLFLLCLFLGLLSAGKSQELDTAVRNIKYSATGIYNRTPDDHSFVFNNNLNFGVVKRKMSLTSSTGYVYGVQQSGLTNNDVSSTLDLEFLRKQQKLYYWVIATYDGSYSLNIDNRFQAGGGLGYTAVDNKTVYLVLTDGPLFETTTLVDSEPYQTIRNSFRLKYKINIKDRVTLSGVNFIQNSVLSLNDYILRASNNLSLKLNRWLSFTVATTYNRLNLNKKENLLCNFGFSIDYTF
ncbi:MAG: DUF481 domain-containing protein [Bacteroidota bacterium]